MLLISRRLVAALFFLSAVPLFAASAPWNLTPMNADPQEVLAAAQAVPAGDSDVVVLLEEERYSFDADGHASIAEHLVYRVVGESAVDQWSTIETLWSPWLQERPDVQARVIAKDGSVHMLDAKSISESAAPESSLDIFSDNRVIRAPLPAVAPGSVVEQLITYKDHNPMYESGINGRFYFGRFVPVQEARLVIESPSSVTPRIVNKTSPAIEPKRQEKDGRTTLTFEAGPLAAIPIEDLEWNLPYDESIRPYIGFSTGKSWKELATRYSAIVDRQIAESSSLGPIVKGAVAGVSDRREVVERLLAAIEKDVRYAGVEIGESSIIPRTPDKVLSLKYGDCKDKATLLVAMLRQAGIPAHVALLRAGEDLDVSPDLPGLGEFNHAIVVVDGATPFWVDPTDDFGRAGYVPSMDQGRQALIADPKTNGLTTVPVTDSAANKTVETRTFTLSEEGKSTVTETTEFRGGTESNARRFYTHRDKKQTRETLENYVKSEYLADSLKDYDFSDTHDMAKPFRVTLTASDAGRGVTDDGEAVVAMLPSNLADNLSPALRAGFDEDDNPHAKKPGKERKKRTHDFVFRMPYMREMVYRIIPPPGYAARPLPQNETVAVGTATLKQQFATNSDGAIVATFTFDSGRRRLSPAEFEAMRTSLHDLLQRKPIIIGFDELGQTKLNAGDIGGALTEFRKLVALHPKEARHHTEVARTLLAGGMGDASREEIRKAIEIEPAYARAHFIYGIIMEHDLFGRPFRKGFDLKTAIAELRKAKELDSQNVDFRISLAKALEIGDDGSVWGRGAHVDEAIAELKAIKTDLKDDRFEGDILSALANAGRFQEMKDLADRLKDQEQRMLGRVVAIGALDSAQAAIREAGTADRQQRQKLLEGAGNTLATLRLYPQAIEILEQAVSGSAKPADMRGQIDVLRKAKRIDPAQLTDGTPAGVVMKMTSEVLLGDATKATIGRWFASPLQPMLLDEADDEEAPSASLAALRSPLDKQGAPVAFLMDLTFASIQTQQDGDDKGGWRVRLRSNGEHEVTDTYYVVRENGAYRIAGARKLPEMIGFTALRFAEAGDLESARRWLNWAREEISAGSADDPLSGAPFALLWPKSKQSATADEVRLAAATLMFRRPFSTRGIEILAQMRDKVWGDAQLYVDSALVTAYSATKAWTKAEPIAKHLVEARPDSEAAIDTYTSVLTQLKKNADVVKLANARLVKLPKDRTALRILARAALVAGDYAKCDEYYREIITDATPEAGDYNNVAWNALFLRRNLDGALEDARRASSLAPSPAVLHTLAALYAETGKSLEARDALLRSMDEAGREEPASHDWYVLGRIAENYGARDAAIAAYKRVQQTKDTGSDSTYVLAKRRMEAMR